MAPQCPEHKALSRSAPANISSLTSAVQALHSLLQPQGTAPSEHSPACRLGFCLLPTPFLPPHLSSPPTIAILHLGTCCTASRFNVISIVPPANPRVRLTSHSSITARLLVRLAHQTASLCSLYLFQGLIQICPIKVYFNKRKQRRKGGRKAIG